MKCLVKVGLKSLELVLEVEPDMDKVIDDDATLDAAVVRVDVVVTSLEDIMMEIRVEYEGVFDGFGWTAVGMDCVVWLGSSAVSQVNVISAGAPV